MKIYKGQMVSDHNLIAKLLRKQKISLEIKEEVYLNKSSEKINTNWKNTYWI